jgi:heat shock protein HslJ
MPQTRYALRATLAAIAVAVMVGCVAAPGPARSLPSRASVPAPAPSPAAEPLAGSRWELVSVQSMSDAQGTTRIADPSRFTVSFGADGRAAFRLDCNRAHATWTSIPGADGRSGRVEFGPIAGTRALCPPPSIDERLTRDLPFVRSYLLRDGQLHLSLMADGGIYSWRPAPR